MSFQIIVVTIAIIVLILILTFIGYGIYTSNHTAKFPPVTSACPDYWKVHGNGDNQECVNINNLGNCNLGKDNTKSFQADKWKGKHGICAKSQWARLCGLTWNGVTNAGATLQKVCGQQ